MIDIICDHEIEFFTVVFSVLGGLFGLVQWKKGNDYKRAEMAKLLINQTRDDKEIAYIIDLIDWNKGIYYKGKFKYQKEAVIKYSLTDEQQLFIAIDRTLAHFNYICYLKALHIFKRKDMALFDYLIKRIFNNIEICNYLYSLLYWTVGLNVACSYKHLICYGLKRGFIGNEFIKEQADSYTHFLAYDPVSSFHVFKQLGYRFYVYKCYRNIKNAIKCVFNCH